MIRHLTKKIDRGTRENEKLIKKNMRLIELTNMQITNMNNYYQNQIDALKEQIDHKSLIKRKAIEKEIKELESKKQELIVTVY